MKIVLRLLVNEAREETMAATNAAKVSPKIPFGNNESIEGYALDLSPSRDGMALPSSDTAIKLAEQQLLALKALKNQQTLSHSELR